MKCLTATLIFVVAMMLAGDSKGDRKTQLPKPETKKQTAKPNCHLCCCGRALPACKRMCLRMPAADSVPKIKDEMREAIKTETVENLAKVKEVIKNLVDFEQAKEGLWFLCIAVCSPGHKHEHK